MKKQLTLEHLAPYLPYGLRIYNIMDKSIVEMTVESEIYKYERKTELNGIASIMVVLNSNTLKPILRSLSDLTKEELRMIISHIFRDTKMIRPKMESVKCDNGFISFYDLDTSHTYVAVKPGKDNLPVMNMSNSFDDYSIFFKLHVDMMGLLDDGIAININDLNK